ncbi:hypothetical protein AVEN_220055-1 [Araneus ventricosus]|uniref:Uncharacterized protein n=1 Tax=Araneus ventricosus TaxID=182803 RepID=A0A4Y2CQA7_ARAVE|nr:hypothetical protein AVEN_220055-1 [Araneus ventricosus]
MKLQCTISYYSIKLLSWRGHVMTLQCDHTSRGLRIAFCTQQSPCPFSADLTSSDSFLRGYLKFKVYRWWGPDVNNLKGQHITDCAEHSFGHASFGRRQFYVQDAMCGPGGRWSH